MADAVQIAEHVVHEDLAVVRRKPFLENIGDIDADLPQAVVRVVQILRRHQVVMIHIVERLFCLVVRVDANRGDNEQGRHQEHGQDEYLGPYGIIFQCFCGDERNIHGSFLLSSLPARHCPA